MRRGGARFEFARQFAIQGRDADVYRNQPLVRHFGENIDIAFEKREFFADGILEKNDEFVAAADSGEGILDGYSVVLNPREVFFLEIKGEFLGILEDDVLVGVQPQDAMGMTTNLMTHDDGTTQRAEFRAMRSYMKEELPNV